MASEDIQNVRMSDGCNIKAKVVGEASKPLLMAFHGAPGISSHKEPERWIIPTFGDKYRILLWDARGCGDSDDQEPFTHEKWIADAEELRQWAKADTVTCVGGSHGGIFTLEYVLAHPDRVEAILVGDSNAQLAHRGTIRFVATALTDPRTKDKIDVDRFIRLVCGVSTDEADFLAAFADISPLYAAPPELKAKAEVDVDQFIKGLTNIHWQTNNAAIGPCMSRYDVRDRLGEIKVPAFIWVGRHDWICPVEMSELIAKGIPNSTLKIYEDSGHIPSLEQKTLFEKDVREWLKAHNLPKKH